MKHLHGRAIAAGLAIISVAMLAACSSSDSTPSSSSSKTYKFGVLIPLTGSNATVGTPMQQGVELEVDAVNSSGVLPAGVKLQPIFADNQADPTKTVSAFNQLIATQKVIASISSYSGPTLAIAPIAQRDKVPLVNNGGVTPTLAGASPYLFNDVPLITQQSLATLDYAVKKEGIKKVALLYTADDLGKGTQKVFSGFVKSLGAEDVGDVQFDPTETKYGLELAKVQQLHPDAVFVTSTAAATGNIISQAASSGFTPTWMGYQAFGHPDTLSVGGSNAEGSFYSTPSTLDPSNAKPYKESQALIDAYNTKFDTTGTPDFTVFTSAEAVQLFAHAVATLIKEHKPVTGANVQGVLAKTSDFPSVLGSVTFQSDGTVLMPLQILKDQNGAFVNATIFDLDQLKAMSK